MNIPEGIEEELPFSWFLADISKSLAVIAEKSEREDKEWVLVSQG
jgi:hypothetical protein